MIILGSTGSIGQSALSLARDFALPIEMLVAGRNIRVLNQQIQEFRPKIVVIADRALYDQLYVPMGTKVFFGSEGILQGLQETRSTLVLNALVGFIGFEPTLTSLQLNKKVALANKESLVVGGHWLLTQDIIPVDSEHFSLWFLKRQHPSFKQLILTASGGAFRDTPIHEIPTKSVAEALKHPNWSMGRKITIDSATMMNKLFEVLEAYHLFDTHNIHAVIERNSIVHALVGFYDGSFTAHLAKSDMRLPLAYALLGEETFSQDRFECEGLFEPLNLQGIHALKFEEISIERYPLWVLKDILLSNPFLGVVVNAANEVAVDRFLKGEICFGKIAQIVFEAIKHFEIHFLRLDEVVLLDAEVRKFSMHL